MSDERRAHPRFAVNLQVTLTSGTTVELASENLSLGGLFLACEAPPCESGEKVTIHLRLPPVGDGEVGEHIEVPSTVMHVVPPIGMGIRFELDDDQVRGRLASYIARLAQVQSELG